MTSIKLKLMWWLDFANGELFYHERILMDFCLSYFYWVGVIIYRRNNENYTRDSKYTRRMHQSIIPIII